MLNVSKDTKYRNKKTGEIFEIVSDNVYTSTYVKTLLDIRLKGEVDIEGIEFETVYDRTRRKDVILCRNLTSDGSLWSFKENELDDWRYLSYNTFILYKDIKGNLFLRELSNFTEHLVSVKPARCLAELLADQQVDNLETFFSKFEEGEITKIAELMQTKCGWFESNNR